MSKDLQKYEEVERIFNDLRKKYKKYDEFYDQSKLAISKYEFGENSKLSNYFNDLVAIELKKIHHKEIMKSKSIFSNVTSLILIWIFIAAAVFIFFNYLGFLQAVVGMIMCFAFACIFVGAILRMEKVITTNNLMELFKMGFKALIFVEKFDIDSADK
jgi:hypothetical protein